MNRRLFVGAALAVAMLCGYAAAGDAPKSGPQVGENIPGPFHVLNACNAENPGSAGQKTCLVWQHGGKSVAMVFAREISDPLTSLVKKLDAEVGKSNKKMGAFVVLLSNDEKAEKALKDLAEKQKIKNVSLTVLENADGPPKYNIAKDADVTIVYYKAHKVAANHAFKKGDFNSKAVETATADLSKIAPK